MMQALTKLLLRRKPKGSSELMNEGEFWKIIHAAKEKAKGDFETQKVELGKMLMKRKPADIASFDNRFYFISNQLYHHDIWAAAKIIDGTCDDDCFDCFREWLIGQGKEVVDTALQNPDSLADYEIESNADRVGLSLMAGNAFYFKTNAELYPDYVLTIQYEIKGEPCEENELDGRLPNLFQKYRKN